jgi:UDP-N-acetylmuramate--alanine ligase
MKMPQTIGLVHFIGIGGIGMSGIAEVLHNLGYIGAGIGRPTAPTSSGCAPRASTSRSATRPTISAMRKWLWCPPPSRRQSGTGRRARALLPIVRRAEMLAELMRFRNAVAIGGTHGKTTTTSMVATLLDAGNLDPTVINGGIINAYGTNARMGAGEWMVVEADESDGTFLKLPADIAVVTNIDPEHLDHYGSFEAVRAAFAQFVENVPFYGFGVMCLDHPEVQALVGRIEDRRIITYGENPQADVRFSNHRMEWRKLIFDVLDPSPQDRRGLEIKDLHCRCPAGTIFRMPRGDRGRDRARPRFRADIRKGLAAFGGVKRRFTHDGILERRPSSTTTAIIRWRSGRS